MYEREQKVEKTKQLQRRQSIESLPRVVQTLKIWRTTATQSYKQYGAEEKARLMQWHHKYINSLLGVRAPT